MIASSVAAVTSSSSLYLRQIAVRASTRTQLLRASSATSRGGGSSSFFQPTKQQREQQQRLHSTSSGNNGNERNSNKNAVNSSETATTTTATTKQQEQKQEQQQQRQQQQRLRPSSGFQAKPAAFSGTTTTVGGVGVRDASSSSYSSSWFEPVYVHPLYQMVLLYFQTTQHGREWIARKGLQRLQVQRDGSFLLLSSTSTTTPNGMIWTCYDEFEKKHWLYYSKKEIRYSFLLKDTTTTTTVRTMQPAAAAIGSSASTTAMIHTTNSNSNNTYNKLRHDSEQVEQSVRDLIQAVEELDHPCTD